MVAVQYTSVIILSAAKYSALRCNAAPAVVCLVHRFQVPAHNHIQIYTWFASAGLRRVGRAHVATPTHKNTTNIYKKPYTHALSAVYILPRQPKQEKM